MISGWIHFILGRPSKVLLSIFLTAVAFGTASNTLAGAPSCQYLFAQEPQVVSRVFYKRLISKSLEEQSPNTEQIKDNVLKLSQALFSANAEAFNRAMSWQKISLKDFTVESVKLIPGQYVDGYGLFVVKLKNEKDYDSIFLQVRSNGYAAFVNKSFQYRQGLKENPTVNKFKASYLEDGEVKLADQGEVLISSLPEQIHLSRVLSQQEREEWVDNKPLSQGPFGARTHFAVNYFRFNKEEPYMIPYSKDQLLEAYRRGDVEINTYDVVDRMQFWRGKIDLEMEIVFVGQKSRESLRPLMQEALRQDILHF